MMDLSASTSKDMATEVAKLTEEKTNEDQTNSDKDQKKFVVPPEYDEHDSRWTLKYREPAPGLVELMEHSGVYVNADKLAEYKKWSNDYKAFARMILTEIFTTSALSTCSWTSETTNASDIYGGQARPELDEHARKILLMFVEEYGLIHNWTISDYQWFLNSMRQILLEMKRDRQGSLIHSEILEENYSDELQEKISVTKSRQIMRVMRCVRRKENYDKLLKEYPRTYFRQLMIKMIRDLQKQEEDFYDELLGRVSHTRKWCLPPEYNEHDSRWTLKYLEPAPGLVELMPHSGVYVNAYNLVECKKLAHECISLIRMLLNEIFTTSALHTCSWTGPTAEDSNHGSTNVRPDLNENAMKTLLNYVTMFALNNDWMVKDDKYTQNSIRQKQEVLKHTENKENTSSSSAKLEEEILRITLKPSNATMDETASSSKDMTAEVAKLNDNDEAQKKCILPPEHNKNDSKLTPNYLELATGLDKLMSDSSVYVYADKLSDGNVTQTRMSLTGKFAEWCKSQNFRSRWETIQTWIRRTFCCCCMKRCSTYDENKIAVGPKC